MMVRMLALIGMGIAFQFAYQVYLVPTFAYASYRNIEMSNLHHLFTYIAIATPSFLFKDRRTPAAFGVALIYVILYVPGQIIIPRMLDSVYFPTLTIQAALVASMATLCYTSSVETRAKKTLLPMDSTMTTFVLVLAVPCLLALVATNYQHMRLVNFADVYDLRADSSRASEIPILAYTNLWLAYCFLPYFITRGILMREKLSMAFGIGGCLIIYLATGAKAQILLPFIVIGIFLTSRYLNLTLAKLAIANTVIILICLIFPSDGIGNTFKFLYLMRTLSTGGFTMSLYYELFSTLEYTYYTHINLIGPIIGTYPYGNYSMGQVIGMQYFNSDLANYNANFWASDGFGAMGIWGIAVITAVFSLTLLVINWLASFYDARFVSLWLTGFWLAVLNLPFSTAMLSGGGLLIMLFLLVGRLNAASDYTGPETKAESFLTTKAIL
jgi:hypothetical protein